MTLSEFKAWFEGFTEEMDGPPSAKAWKKIQARVKEITGTPISYPVYIDRYVRDRPYYDRFWGPYATYGVSGAAGVGAVQCNNSLQSAGQNGAQAEYKAAVNGFDSHQAMYAAGKADVLELTASKAA